MGLELALIIVGILIGIVALVSFFVSIWLSIKYVKFNRKRNSSGMTGQQVARKILDDNGLQLVLFHSCAASSPCFFLEEFRRMARQPDTPAMRIKLSPRVS